MDDTHVRFEHAERWVADALPVLISYVDQNRVYRFNNLAYEHWFGGSRANFEGRHVRDVLGSGAYEEIEPHITKALAGEAVRFEAKLMYQDGITRFVEAHYLPDRAPDGAVRGFVALISDISERMRLKEAAEGACAEASLLYRLTDAVNRAHSLEEVFDTSLDAIQSALGIDRASILLLDSDNVMRFKAWHGLTAAYRAAVEGHSPWAPDAKDPEPIFVRDVETDPAMASYLPLFKAEGIGALAFVPLVHESRLLGKFMLYSAEPRAFSAREIAISKSIAHQVASAVGQKLAQRDRDRLIEELSNTLRLNELFVAVLGHDLRNPLGAILASVQIMLRRGDAQRILRPLTRILNSGERMARMIDQVLDFTRARSGSGMPLQRQTADLASVCRQVVGELQDANPDREVSLEIMGNAGGYWDPDRLGQVISNLVGNAIQHGEERGAVSVQLDASSPDAVCLRVANDGLIPDPLRLYLFDPFRGAEQRHGKGGSLGLGLYITREIVRAHGGTIDCASGSSRTVFTVKLPRRATNGASLEARRAP